MVRNIGRIVAAAAIVFGLAVSPGGRREATAAGLRRRGLRRPWRVRRLPGRLNADGPHSRPAYPWRLTDG